MNTLANVVRGTGNMIVPAGALSVLEGVGISPADLTHQEVPLSTHTSLRGALYSLASDAGEFGRELRRFASLSSEAFAELYD